MMVTGIQILGRATSETAEILTPEALNFIAELAREFEPRRRELMEARVLRQGEIDSGQLPDFIPETKHIREGSWRVAPAPLDLTNRRVELTGPCSNRRMVINALNSGAQVYMTDFEDAHSPGWTQTIAGQLNIRDAVLGTISEVSSEGKSYKLNDTTATLCVRPRGFHLLERHLIIDGRPIAASFFDFGLTFFHCARVGVERGTGPYFYLPKMQSHLEARLWNDIFNRAQDRMGIPRGTVRVTVLIEHILAAFEMEEILYELRDHATGLNLGRWDYIYSFIKVFQNYPDFVLPDRNQVTMSTHFLRSAAELMVYTCHKRGAHALGGMSTYIPRKDDSEANQGALAQVRADKEREAGQGHDGAWVAHPALVPLVSEVFQQAFTGPNQISLLPETKIAAEDLLRVPNGEVTEEGVRENISASLQYLDAWMQGTGAVAIFGRMEDTATAEIARSQLWQWIHYGALLTDRRKVDAHLWEQVCAEEVDKLLEGRDVEDPKSLDKAVELLNELVNSPTFTEFLTIPGYRSLE